ncbi:MAG: type II toxin-antitoxin system RelE/ParE family toxin [Pseudomonadales bacterium]
MKLQFSHQADHDLDRLYSFLIKNKASLRTADKAILAIKKGAKQLLDNPELGISLDDSIERREWSVPFGKRAYILRYIPDYEDKVIRVLRIWHSREDRD